MLLNRSPKGGLAGLSVRACVAVQGMMDAMSRQRVLSRKVLILSVIAGVLLPSSATADNLFSSLSGSWAGAGQIRLEGGSTESLKCRAFYTSKDDGAGLGLAIRCASTSNKIELRATLVYSGGKISGKWEERQFNAGGNVTGQASSSRVSLAIEGGGVSGSMTVSLNGSTQSVSILTNGIALKAVNINLSRS
ncbi:MAG: hypothetical protein ABWZ74_05735 [Hyphomicrobiaceae bacterium]